MTRTFNTIALAGAFLLVLIGGACLTAIPEIPRWALVAYGMFIMTSGWCILDVLCDLWRHTDDLSPEPPAALPVATFTPTETVYLSGPTRRGRPQIRHNRF